MPSASGGREAWVFVLGLSERSSMARSSSCGRPSLEFVCSSIEKCAKLKSWLKRAREVVLSFGEHSACLLTYLLLAYLSIYLSIKLNNLSIYGSVLPPIHESVHRSIYPSAYLRMCSCKHICRQVYLFIYRLNACAHTHTRTYMEVRTRTTKI